jgi:F-type H+-transporting ATPase subunit gamma
MDMANLNMIKSKIKSVQNIKKITRAMEVVSTVKLQKSKHRAEAMKEYLLDLFALISQVGVLDDAYDTISEAGDWKKLDRGSQRKLIIAIATDRGLCGAMNTKLFKTILEKHSLRDWRTDVFVIWRKGMEFFKRAKATIVWGGHISDRMSDEELLPLYTFFDEAVKSWVYSSIDVYFNYFKNSLTQIPMGLQIFPLRKESFHEMVAELWLTYGLTFSFSPSSLVIEPDMATYHQEVKRQVRNYVLLSAVVQNKTGEHAARMIAMKNAKDNATTLAKKLVLNFNKARQWAITQEISEIVSAGIAIGG